MKKRPIIFSAPMVRAILAGTKTQTRRAWREQPSPELLADYAEIRATRGSTRTDAQMLSDCLPCPYGAPGDRLWVREAWRVARKHDAVKPSELPQRGMTVEYEAGGYACNSPWNGGQWSVSDDTSPREHPEWVGKLRPGIHMPRWASRITLEITGVRVQRLQDISEADAIAEGVRADKAGRPDDDAAAFWRIGPVRGDSFPIARYAALWESINGAGSWDANPWVWVVEFQHPEASQ